MFSRISLRTPTARVAVAAALAVAPAIALAAPAAATPAPAPVVTEIGNSWGDPLARAPWQCNWWDPYAPWWERCENPWDNRWNNPWNNP